MPVYGGGPYGGGLYGVEVLSGDVALQAFQFIIEADFLAGPRTASPTWAEVSSRVLAAEGISLRRGAQGEGRAALAQGGASLTFDNGDGTLTAGSKKLRCPLRIQVRRADVGSYLPLWNGFVDDWGGQRRGRIRGAITPTMTDRAARFVDSKLKSLVSAEILSDGPAAYYPLTDDGGTTAVADATGAAGVPALAMAQLGTGGGIDFGVGRGPGPDDDTLVSLTPVDTVNGVYLQQVNDQGLDSNAGLTLEAFVRPGSVQQMSAARVWFYSDAQGGGFTELGTDAAGRPRALIGDFGPFAGALTSPVPLDLNETSHIAVTHSPPVAGVITFTLWQNGTAVASGTFARGAGYAYTRLNIGGHSGGDMYDGQVSNVAVTKYPLAAGRIADHAAARDGFDGERSDQRFERLCRLAGIPSALYSSSGAGLSTMGPQPTKGQPILTLLQQVQDAEQGDIYVTAAGTMRFRPRSARYNPGTALVLDATKTGHLQPDMGITLNTEDLLNDVTATRPGGATVHVLDQASIDAYDIHEDSRTVYVSTDELLQSSAEWAVFTRKDPVPQAKTVVVNVGAFLHSGGDFDDLMAVDVGNAIRLTNLPADLSLTPTLDLFVEGIGDQIGANAWLRTFNVSPMGRNGGVLVLDDAVFGRLDVGLLAF